MKFTLLLTIAALSVVAAKTLPEQSEWTIDPLTDSVQHQQVLDVLGGSRSGRIVNGEKAVEGQFPYMAGVFPFFNVTGQIVCGGSVISPSLILTAAHCLVHMTRAEIYAGLIHSDPFSPNRTSSYRSTVTDTAFIIHASYERVTRRNDIGLIRLTRDIPFNNRVSAIALPLRSDVGTSFINSQATLAGFGVASDSATERNWDLRFITQTIIENAECVRLYGNSIVTDETMCNAGTGGRSSCNGDGGGPVVITRNGSPVQVGIINFGSSLGCERGFAQVNVRLTSYLDWIQTNTGIVIQ